jgi:glycosyltransferase involved in cell wall biosynthesis
VLIFIVSFFSLRKILLCERPKYLIIHLVSSVPLILLFFFNFETNFILRISGLPKLNFIRKFIWKYSGKKLFLITCPSLETKNYLLKLNIFPENKIVVLLDPILNLSEIITKKKENIDVPHNRKYFLSIGRLTRQKNHMLLIKLFATIFKNSSNFFLYIIGDGEDKLKLIKKIKELKLEDRIFLLGYKNNIFPYLYNAKALLSSSLWEDPGAVMIEAAFCNVTIISSDCVSGPKEFIENNKAGYIFRNNNFQSLLSVFQKFLEENNKNIFFKKINAKKKTIKFTVFRHYQQLNYFLS